jgi:thiamine-monophosphate kinase
MPRGSSKRSVADLGEFGLIDRIERRARRVTGRRVRIGIGDDAAVLRPAAGFDVVLTTDTLVEDVHFRFATEAAKRIGHRALVANLSDLASMGARPIGFTCALQAPATLSVSRVDALFDGLLATAELYGVPLVGGNVARARETSLAITAVGEVERGRALTRAGLRAGDRLFVTGRLGAAALAVARAERTGKAIRHRPVARIEAGRALVASRRCSACIDCSDGLAADLGHMLEASGVGAEIDASAVPRAPGLDRGARALGLDADTLCFAGGEDYELIFGLRPGSRPGLRPGSRAAASRRRADALVADLERRLGTVVTEIGRVTAAGGLRGLPVIKGHTHF